MDLVVSLCVEDHKLKTIGHGAPVVWVHGLGESSRCFEACVQNLMGYKNVLVDLPGYGRTARVEQTYSLSQAADQLVDLLSEIGPATVIGHSMGGVIGTLLAQKRPDLLTCLLNVDGNISIGDCGYSRPICSQAEAKAKVELVQPSGYWPFIDQPQAFTAILKNFLCSNAPHL